jgi:hypothetical protein
MASWSRSGHVRHAFRRKEQRTASVQLAVTRFGGVDAQEGQEAVFPALKVVVQVAREDGQAHARQFHALALAEAASKPQK